MLLAAIRDVQAGTITPSQAAALSGLARAYVAVHEAGLVEAKIDQIRAMISERTAS